jgi:hypothetical protein
MSVSLTGFVPSLLHAQISLFPELVDAKAILFLSGEMTGCSSSEEQENSGFDGGFIASFPVSSILQMSELPVVFT